jgi:hypothetical protein
MPLPWIALLAGTLANRMQSEGAKKDLVQDVRRRQAKRLGGNTEMLDAMTGKKAIENQESDNMSNMLVQQLVGKMGEPSRAGTNVTSGNGLLGGSVGGTGLRESDDLKGVYDPSNRSLIPDTVKGSHQFDPDDEERQRRAWSTGR